MIASHDAPAMIRHLLAMGSRSSAQDIDVTPTSRGGYRVTIRFARQDKRMEIHFARRKRRWVATDVRCFENNREVKEGDLGSVMRALSTSGDRVGAPAEHTRHPGANPSLVTRSHTIIRN